MKNFVLGNQQRIMMVLFILKFVHNMSLCRTLDHGFLPLLIIFQTKDWSWQEVAGLGESDESGGERKELT